MRFNSHSDLEGKHAYLSASNPYWMGYDDDKFDRVYRTEMQSRRGVRLHKLACELIRNRVNLPDTSATLNMYVNESIGFRMEAEQPLYYSDNAYGTPDAIGLMHNKLRISDLKTGVGRVKFDQLEAYAALFCLEYGYKPDRLEVIELRIYQNDQVQLMVADPVAIHLIMEKYKYLDKRIQYLESEAM